MGASKFLAVEFYFRQRRKQKMLHIDLLKGIFFYKIFVWGKSLDTIWTNFDLESEGSLSQLILAIG